MSGVNISFDPNAESTLQNLLNGAADGGPGGESFINSGDESGEIQGNTCSTVPASGFIAMPAVSRTSTSGAHPSALGSETARPEPLAVARCTACP